MNKSELIKKLADETKITVDEADCVISNVFDSIKDSLMQGKRVEIRGFGSFKVKEYAAYSGRNPKTGKVVSVAAKRLPFFRPGKEVKEVVNN